MQSGEPELERLCLRLVKFISTIVGSSESEKLVLFNYSQADLTDTSQSYFLFIDFFDKAMLFMSKCKCVVGLHYLELQGFALLLFK